MKKFILINYFLTFLFVTPVFSQSNYENPNAFLQKCKCINEKWGYKIQNGNEVIIECIYDNVEEFECIYIDGTQDGRKKHFARVNLKGKWGIIDAKGELIVPCIYNKINQIFFNTTLLSVEKDGKWGYLDYNKNWTLSIPCKYDAVKNFSNCNYLDAKIVSIAEVKLNGKWGIINQLGNEIIPCKYEDFQPIFNYNNVFSTGNFTTTFKDGLIRAKTNSKWGVIDSNDKIIIQFNYDEIIFEDEYIKVKINDKIGWLDRKSYNEVIPCLYDDIIYFSDKNEFIRVKLGDKYGLLDKSYKIFIPIHFDFNIQDLGNFVKVKTVSQTYSDRKYGLYDKLTGKELLPAIFTDISFADEKNKYASDSPNETNNYFLRIEKNDLYGLCDMNGKEILSCKYSSIQPFDNLGFAIVSVEGQFGVFNRLGKEIIPCKFDKIYPFSRKGFAKVEFENKFGLYDTNGKEIISCQYQDIGTFDDAGFIGVYSYGVWKYIDKEGNLKQTNNNYENSIIISPVTEKDSVDIYIPTNSILNDKTFVVIIANELYKTEAKVEYAINDGFIFREYCVKTLGVPVKNVHYVPNGTLNDIRKEINWLINIDNAFRDEAKIIFYYAGHGIPDDSSKESYLLPIDGYSSDISTGYSLDYLYSEFGKFSAKQVIVFLDACFTGSKRDGNVLSASRGVSVKPKFNTPLGNMVVFSASQDTQTANQYKEKKHGLFTYYLLKKLQETEGNVSLYELSNYVIKCVSQKSIVENEKIQTPSISISIQLRDNWKNLKLIEK